MFQAMLWGRGKTEVRNPGPQKPHIPVGGESGGKADKIRSIHKPTVAGKGAIKKIRLRNGE